MLTVDEWAGTAMGDALMCLADALADNGHAYRINVIGGFALMEYGLRDRNAVTDIDYVGDDLGPEFDALADQIGLRYGLGRGWINKSVMLAGSTLDDFEDATGPLHFAHAFDVRNLSIYVLDRTDLLRMKLIALDTSLMGCEYGGEFTRMKDIPDVILLAKDLDISQDALPSIGRPYVLNDRVYDLVRTWVTDGTAGVNAMVTAMQRQALLELGDLDG